MSRNDQNHFQVASSGTARDINRRILLSLANKHQPISRASLARLSGMQRSTVSAIVEQLISERWLVEGAVGHLPRGRNPTYLHLNPDRAGIIGVDIHPTATMLAVASIGMQILAQESILTEPDPQAFIKQLGRRINQLTRAHPRSSYEGIGISVPGRVNPATQRITFAPNLDWQDLDLKSPLERITGLRVELENAANACALAELWSGRHGDRVANIVTVTVAEGIGVGMIMNGQLVRGVQGVAGEFGHVTLAPEGPRCRCGNRGCWEVLASDSAALRHHAAIALAANGGDPPGNHRPGSFTGLLQRVAQEDPGACQALEQMATHLGAGLALLVTGLAPDVLVVVGEVTRAWDRVKPVIEQILQRSCARASTRILTADQDQLPRLRGAVALIAHQHFILPQI